MSDDSENEESTAMKKKKAPTKRAPSDDEGPSPKKRSKVKKPRFDLDLAEEEVSGIIPEFRINLSNTHEMYLRAFKNAHYLGFGRRDDAGGEPKYRFNLPLTLFPKIKEGVRAIDKLIKECQ